MFVCQLKIMQNYFELKSGFKGTINSNKYLSKVESYNAKKPYLDKLIDPSFQGVNRLFALPFENA